MNKYNMLPQVPESLYGDEIKVEYTSSMAQAQKIAGTSTIEQFTAFLANVANFSPDVIDTVNFDKAVNKYGESLGVDASILRSDYEIEQIRRERQLQQQQMQSQATMANMANMAKTLGETPTGDPNKPNALDSVIGGMGEM